MSIGLSVSDYRSFFLLASSVVYLSLIVQRSFCPFVCLFISLSLLLSIFLFFYLSNSDYPSLFLSVSDYPSLFLSVFLFVSGYHLSSVVHPSVCLSVCLFVCLYVSFINLCFCPSVCLSVCLSVSVSYCPFLSIRLSVIYCGF